MLNEYEVTRNGITYTMMLEEDTAKERKLKPVQRKGATPPNKSRAPRDKAAPNVARTPED